MKHGIFGGIDDAKSNQRKRAFDELTSPATPLNGQTRPCDRILTQLDRSAAASRDSFCFKRQRLTEQPEGLVKHKSYVERKSELIVKNTPTTYLIEKGNQNMLMVDNEQEEIFK